MTLGSGWAFPSHLTETLMCIPFPSQSASGLGEKLAQSPFCAATVRTIAWKVTALSAAARGSEYRKSISFCPGPLSWWELSGQMPIRSSIRQISRRIVSPLSSGAMSM